MKASNIFFVLLVLGVVLAVKGTGEESEQQWRPVVLMHGLLASAEAMSHAQKWIEADFPVALCILLWRVFIRTTSRSGTVVPFLIVGRDDSLTMDINEQVEKFAASVRSDPKLRQGFNLIGHSQGGLLSRAYIERFNDPPVYNFISWAGPMDGVYGVPDLNAM